MTRAHRQVKPTAAEIETAVQRAGRTRLDRRDTTDAVDLSREAISARQRAELRGGDATGAQLVTRADLVFSQAKRLARQAQRASTARRRAKLDATSDEALVTAATQIRIAQLCPLDRGYLHAVDLSRIQTVRAEVAAAFDEDPAALAVDTHRRIQDQRMRVKTERGT
jgi:hypothetical protein